MNNEEGSGNELVAAVTNTAMLTSIVFSVCGLPVAGACVGAAAVAAEYARAYQERRNAAKRARADKMIQKLISRLHNENLDADDWKMDLFIEVVKKALEDDEAEKDVFYAAVLEWISRDTPTAAHVRILSDAVSRLSYVELFCCMQELHDHMPREALQAERIPTTLYRKRLASVGLGDDGPVQGNHSVTPHAAILRKYVDMADLAVPRSVGSSFKMPR